MHHRFWRRAIVATLVLALAVLGGTAAIAKAPKKAPKKTTIEMKGKTTVKRNKFIKDAVHFSPGKASIRSGSGIDASIGSRVGTMRSYCCTATAW